MKRVALVVDIELPDDAIPDTALRPVLDAIHATLPTPASNVTAYIAASADLIAEAARVGHIVDQAERLRLEPGDIVKIVLPGSFDDHEWLAENMPKLFADNKVLVLENGETLTTQRENPAAFSD